MSLNDSIMNEGSRTNRERGRRLAAGGSSLSSSRPASQVYEGHVGLGYKTVFCFFTTSRVAITYRECVWTHRAVARNDQLIEVLH